MDKKLKLTIELVPQTIWFKNLRSSLKQEEWDKIRREAYAKYNHVCGICKSSGRMNCHEIWDYDDENKIQTLKGFISLCGNCHWIKHIGLASIKDSEGELDMDEIIDHFCKVNNVDRKFAKQYIKEAFKIWSERSKYKWKQDLRDYKDLIK
jgi:hypothetical protein